MYYWRTWTLRESFGVLGHSGVKHLEIMVVRVYVLDGMVWQRGGRVVWPVGWLVLLWGAMGHREGRDLTQGLRKP